MLILFYKFNPNLSMDGFAKSELSLRKACCTGPDPNRPIGKFQVDVRI